MSEKTAAAPAGTLIRARRRLCVALLVLLGFSLVACALVAADLWGNPTNALGVAWRLGLSAQDVLPVHADA